MNEREELDARLQILVELQGTAQEKLDRVCAFMNAVEIQFRDRAPKEYIDRRGTCAQLVCSAESCQSLARRRIKATDFEGALSYISSGEEKLKEFDLLANALLEYVWIVSTLVDEFPEHEHVAFTDE